MLCRCGSRKCNCTFPCKCETPSCSCDICRHHRQRVDYCRECFKTCVCERCTKENNISPRNKCKCENMNPSRACCGKLIRELRQQRHLRNRTDAAAASSRRKPERDERDDTIFEMDNIHSLSEGNGRSSNISLPATSHGSHLAGRPARCSKSEESRATRHIPIPSSSSGAISKAPSVAKNNKNIRSGLVPQGTSSNPFVSGQPHESDLTSAAHVSGNPSSSRNIHTSSVSGSAKNSENNRSGLVSKGSSSNTFVSGQRGESDLTSAPHVSENPSSQNIVRTSSISESEKNSEDNRSELVSQGSSSNPLVPAQLDATDSASAAHVSENPSSQNIPQTSSSGTDNDEQNSHLSTPSLLYEQLRNFFWEPVFRFIIWELFYRLFS